MNKTLKIILISVVAVSLIIIIGYLYKFQFRDKLILEYCRSQVVEMKNNKTTAQQMAECLDKNGVKVELKTGFGVGPKGFK